MCPTLIDQTAFRAAVFPTAARKTTADADSVARQSQDYKGWRCMLPRFKSSRPDYFASSNPAAACGGDWRRDLNS
jgi:hypothetical protein